jgi:hypothetical protein
MPQLSRSTLVRHPFAINPHIDWLREPNVGIDIKLSHLAATPPSLCVILKDRAFYWL